MPKEVEKGTVMTRPEPRSPNLLAEARCDRAGISHTTFQSAPLDEAVAQTHDRFPKHWYPGEVEDDPGPSIAARNPHTVPIIVGIDSDDPHDPRVLLRGNDQRDNATDGNSGKRNIFKVELIEKVFNANKSGP